MKPIGKHNYYVYILTNLNRTVLYTGVTNSVEARIMQHKADAEGEKKTFTGKYNCVYVIYMEHFQYINNAIAREKEIKGWTRAKKEALINGFNPKWDFLNEQW
jgi:putative endonuclease